MELFYLIAIVIVAISSLAVIYFIVKANTESNREIIAKLTNRVIAENNTEYLVLNEADKPATKKAEPKDDRYVSLDEMQPDDWDKALQ